MREQGNGAKLAHISLLVARALRNGNPFHRPQLMEAAAGSARLQEDLTLSAFADLARRRPRLLTWGCRWMIARIVNAVGDLSVPVA